LSSRRRSKDACGGERVRAFSGTDCDRVPHAQTVRRASPAPIRRLAAPSETTGHRHATRDRSKYTAHEFAARRDSDGVAVPRSDQCFSNGFASGFSNDFTRTGPRCLTATREAAAISTGTSRNGANPRRVAPENRFQLAEIPLRQVSAASTAGNRRRRFREGACPWPV